MVRTEFWHVRVSIYPFNECGQQALGNRSGNYVPDTGATRITCGRLLIDA